MAHFRKDVLSFILGTGCNFSCNYCPSFLHSGDFAQGRKSGFPSDEEIFLFIDKIEDIVKEKNLVLQVQFGGGEPLLHPLLPKIINRLKEITSYIGITTNGSRSVKWWENIFPLYNVSISLHHEFTNIEKINELGLHIIDNNKSSLMFNLSCDPLYWKESISLYEKLDDRLKSFVSPKVLNQLGTSNKENFVYTKEQKEKIKQMDRQMQMSPAPFPPPSDRYIHFNDATREKFSLAKITINNWNQFKGWDCNVGSECLNVDFKGDVFAGVCKSMKLGTLTDFELYTESISCPFNYCVCPGDIRSSKNMKL